MFEILSQGIKFCPLTISLKAAVPHQPAEETRGVFPDPVTMSSLLDLPQEVLEKILLQVEAVEDVISLGSSNPLFAAILHHEKIWRIIVATTEMVRRGMGMKNRIRTISAFLSSLPNSDSLLSLLHRTIYHRYPVSAPCPATCEW